MLRLTLVFTVVGLLASSSIMPVQAEADSLQADSPDQPVLQPSRLDEPCGLTCNERAMSCIDIAIGFFRECARQAGPGDTVHFDLLICHLKFNQDVRACEAQSEACVFERCVSSGKDDRPDAARRQVAGKPKPVSAREVDGMFHSEQGTGRLGDVSQIVGLFRKAETSRELDHLAGAALVALEQRGDPELRALVHRTYNQVSPGVEPAFTANFEGTGLCDIDFDNPEVLDMFVDDAQATFSTPPHWVEPCGTGEIRVEPTVWSHYHLNYEDPTIDCIDENGLFGTGEPGNCTALQDPTQEPRYLGSHQGSEVIRIRLIGNDGPLPFTMNSFYNVGDEPVRFSYQTGGGDWFQWQSLEGNTQWDVGGFVINVLEVQIVNAGHSTSCVEEGWDSWEAAFPGDCPTDYQPFYLDDFDIQPFFQ